MQALLVAALALLAASMGECVWWLWRRRQPCAAPDGTSPPSAAVRTASPWRSPSLALLLVWAALVAPTSRAGSPSARSRGSRSSSSSWSPGRPAARHRAPRAGRGRGRVLSVLVLVKVLDIGFFTAFDRPFKPVDDSSYVGIGIETLRDAIGTSSRGPRVAAAACSSSRSSRSRSWRCCA
jgi:hypothetical protein